MLVAGEMHGKFRLTIRLGYGKMWMTMGGGDWTQISSEIDLGTIATGWMFRAEGNSDYNGLLAIVAALALYRGHMLNTYSRLL